MLDNARRYAAYHAQAASASLKNLSKKPIATLMTMIVIAITLTLPSLFWIFSTNLKQLTLNWQQGGHISLYLKPGLPITEQSAALDAVRQTPGVGHASLVSPEEGLEELQSQEGMHDVMRYLAENPLPAVIQVIPALSTDDPLKLDQLFQQVKIVPQVEQAKLDMDWIKRLHAFLGLTTSIAHGLMALLACAVVFIIGNTLRLALHNRSEEIQVLKLIGASDTYILRPFLYTGIWYGLVGALLAILFVNVFLMSLTVAANKLASVYQMHAPSIGFSGLQMMALLLFATWLGFLGARLSVKKQLRVIEPY